MTILTTAALNLLGTASCLTGQSGTERFTQLKVSAQRLVQYVRTQPQPLLMFQKCQLACLSIGMRRIPQGWSLVLGLDYIFCPDLGFNNESHLVWIVVVFSNPTAGGRIRKLRADLARGLCLNFTQSLFYFLLVYHCSKHSLDTKTNLCVLGSCWPSPLSPGRINEPVCL